MTEVSVPVAVSGVGHYVPERVVTNDHLAPLLETTPDWIADRSGIRERRFAAPDQTNADLALRAARIALDRAGLAPDALDMIVVATLSPDHFFPGVSAALQAGLGVTRPIPSFDLHAQCGGFIYALGVAQGLLASGRYAHVLVVGSERQSSPGSPRTTNAPSWWSCSRTDGSPGNCGWRRPAPRSPPTG
jgi:3-oxoacyl-[acyl-carrier-protein] synthase-3